MSASAYRNVHLWLPLCVHSTHQLSILTTSAQSYIYAVCVTVSSTTSYRSNTQTSYVIDGAQPPPCAVVVAAATGGAARARGGCGRRRALRRAAADPGEDGRVRVRGARGRSGVGRRGGRRGLLRPSLPRQPRRLAAAAAGRRPLRRPPRRRRRAPLPAPLPQQRLHGLPVDPHGAQAKCVSRVSPARKLLQIPGGLLQHADIYQNKSGGGRRNSEQPCRPRHWRGQFGSIQSGLQRLAVGSGHKDFLQVWLCTRRHRDTLLLC